ncbi:MULTISPECIES: hypothetical protein [unclassified Rhodococcus (in: high G+C Gram-positive bacteria)]|uniref:hypothetical protein n=1 Tax=unclassified Rhodococcus (in: high G+C Gram-positive bacteria) TaxID=192944 RepID=UPI00117B97C2|nr:MULTISPECIES: hypothetical protein [unclassified Rhodococcus (in: high G+C Gram-positive bacteria)]
MTPRVGFGEIANPTLAKYRKGEIYDRAPTTGAAPMDVVEIIRDHLDFTNCLALSWEGNADISAQFPAEDYPRISIVDYDLFLPLKWVEHPVELPVTRFNYLWPQSRNWVIASGVDSQDTILAAADMDLITRVGSDLRLETIRMLSNCG